MRFSDQHRVFTGFATAQRFEHELANQIARTSGPTGCALLRIDVGARFEEPQIAAVAQDLRRRLRTSDLVTRTDRREFAVLLHHMDRGHAILVADALLDAIHSLAMARWQIPSSASIGLAISTDVMQLDADLVAQAAGLAMNEAKRSPYDRLAVFDPRRHELGRNTAAARAVAA
ncbi:MAG: GGDEF domain-containing protein [Solirubrobacterales bacterium]